MAEKNEISDEKRAEYIAKLVEFVRKQYYQDLIKAANKGVPLEIDFQILEKFNPEIAALILAFPDTFFDLSVDVIKQIELPREGEEEEKPTKVRIFNLPEMVGIRDLRSKHIGKFISTEGIVRKASEIRPEITETVWQCLECGDMISQPRKGSFISKPYQCDCGNRTFKQVDNKKVDTRWIVIEEPFELTEGEKPSQLTILLSDDLCTSDFRSLTDPGNRLKFCGILRDIPKGKTYSVKLDFYLQANFIKPTEIGFEKIEISKEDEREIKKLARDPKVYEYLVDSLAPSLYGLRDEKEAIIMQLFGGVRKKLKDNTKIRGNIHVLAIGDPSSGKSQLLKLVPTITPRGRYVSGKGVTTAGLCVAPGTLVQISDGSFRQIKDIIENEFKKNGKNVEGDIQTSKKPSKMKVISFDSRNMTLKPMMVTQYFKIKSPKKMIKIRTRNRKEIEVTLDNPIPVLRNNKLRWCKAVNLKKFDLIASSFKDAINNPDVNWDKITFFETIDSPYEYVYDLTVEGGHSFVANGLIVHNTASVTKDEQFMGGWVLEAGAMVLSHKGLLSVDEFEKMNPDDQVAMHEALEQGCYDYNTEIILGNGEISKIGDFVEKHTSDEKGEKIKKNIYNKKIDIISTDFNKIMKSRITAVGKHKERKMIKIILSDGKELTITQNHPVFTFKDSKINLIEARQLKKNDMIPIPRSFAITKFIESIEKRKIKNSKFTSRNNVTSSIIKWIRIKNIKSINGTRWVYDVTVNPTQTFIGNGIVCHNSVSIAKASIVTTLPAETSVLAGGNPKWSRFDPYKSIAEQIIIPETLLSLGRNEPMLIEENGNFRIDKIGNIVDKFYSRSGSGTPVFVENIRVPALNINNYKIEWMPVKYVFRHKPKNRLYELVFETGRSINVTKGHSVYVFEDGEIKPKPSHTIKEGDYIVIPKSLPPPTKTLKSINLPFELLNLPEYNKNIFLHNVPQEVIKRLKITNNNWKGGKRLPLRYAHKMEKSELKKCTIKCKGGSRSGVPVEIPVNKELMRLIGYYVAEGSMLISGSREHLVSFSFSRKDKKCINDMKKIAKNLFNHNITMIGDKNAVKVNIANKIVFLLLKEILKLQRGAANKRIPNIVFNVSKPLQKNFIKAYHAGDYCVSISKGLISDLFYLFLQNNMIVSCFTQSPKKVKFPDGHICISKTSYGINDADRIVKTFRGIKKYSYVPLEPVKNTIKALSIEKYKGSYNGKKCNKYITGNKWLENKFYSSFMVKKIKRLELLTKKQTAGEFAKKIYKINGKHKRFRTKREWSRQYLNRLVKRKLINKEVVGRNCYYYLSSFGRDVLNKIKRLEKLINSDLGFVRVSSIKTTKPSSYVYDISVPGHENFIAGFGGVVCHNSRFDLKFALRDIPNAKRDKLLVDHVLKSREEDNVDIKPKLDPMFIRKYIAYTKQHCEPELSREAGDMLKKFYIQTRKKAEGGDAPIPITLRQFESLIRISEASAKIQLSDVVRKEDAQRAIRLMRASLRQLGFDPDTGQIDIDRAEGATTHSERSRLRIVMDIITEMSLKKKEIPMKELEAEAKKEGVEDIYEIVERLKREGMLFEPNPGYIQKV